MVNKLPVIVLLFCFLSDLTALSAQDGETRFINFDVIKYSFQIELNDSNDIIRGEAKIDINFLKQSDTLYLDLAGMSQTGKGMTVEEIRDESGPVAFIHSGNKIRVPVKDYLANETKQYGIKYSGIPADGLIISKNKFGDRTFFGDNWPNRAHQWLPCIDHPSDKATSEFIVIAPSHYQVVSNGLLRYESISNNIITSHWVCNVPLPTKLLVIGVADFARQELATVSGIPVSTWVYPQNKTEGFNDYAAAVKPFVYFTDLIAPFPFSKLANVQSTTLYGGMENAGCIFYAENSVTGTGRSERLMAHEIAHQWFGDAVSEKDWYHIWLSEGFATYLTGMYIEQNYGHAAFLKHINTEKAKVFAYEKYRLSPIIDTSLSVSAELLSPNTYQKASWVIHMLRKELGDSLFIKSLQNFYNENKYQSVLTKDFQNVVERISGRSFSIFFEQWLYKAGHPILDIKWSQTEHSLVINIKQLQTNTIFRFPLEFKIINKNSVAFLVKLDINTLEQSFTIPYNSNPLEIIPDPANWLLMESTVREENISN